VETKAPEKLAEFFIKESFFKICHSDLYMPQS